MQFLTIDVEEWYHANYEGMVAHQGNGVDSHLSENVDRLIDLCDASGVKTTCFVLGEVAVRYPQIVRKLADAGHEIASHGHAHEAVNALGPERFKADVIRANHALEDVTGLPVLGYRAPSFSVDRENLDWFYATLEDAGLVYSSSIFPGRTFLYGIEDFPAEIHYPQTSRGRTSILEVPVNRLRVMNWDMGLYFRLFPAAFIRYYIRRQEKRGRHTVIYLHPREIDTDQPRLDLPPLPSLIHYWGVSGCERKIKEVLTRGPRDYLRMADLIEEAHVKRAQHREAPASRGEHAP